MNHQPTKAKTVANPSEHSKRNLYESMQFDKVSLFELINLFGKPVEIMIDRSRLHPEFVKYLDITSDITDARDGSKLTAWLPIIASNIGNRVHILNNSSRIFCSIWAMIIGPSSISRKTTVIKLAQQTLDRWEERLSDKSPEAYLKDTSIMTDVSFTKMLSMLAVNPNRVFIQMEVSSWLRLMNNNWNSGMKQSLTDLYDGIDKTIANMDRCERIRKPAFSICSATTEGWFLSEMNNLADQQSGFLHRFLYCVIKNIDAREVDISYREGNYVTEVMQEYDDLYTLLRQIPENTRLRLSEEAIAIRNTEYAKVFKYAVGMRNDTLIGYFTRIYDGYFFKFCIILHIFEHLAQLQNLAVTVEQHADAAQTLDQIVGQSPSADETSTLIGDILTTNRVSPETVRQALYLCDYFQNTIPFLSSLSDSTKLQNERKLIELMIREPNGTIRHSALLNRSHFHKIEFKEAIESLRERGALRVTSRTAANGNRSGKIYVINEALLKSWNGEGILDVQTQTSNPGDKFTNSPI